MQVILTPIKESDLQLLIFNSFVDDFTLKNVYHRIAPASLEDIVVDTYNVIKGEAVKADLAYFRVAIVCGNDIEPIGFTVIANNRQNDHNVLYSFGIYPKYRLKPILKSWLSIVEKYAGFPFYVGLYKRNIRAINFFKRNDFKIDGEGENYVSMLPSKSLNICQ